MDTSPNVAPASWPPARRCRTVSGRLGHANAATTLGVYPHFVEASDQDAAELLGQLLAKASANAAEQGTP